MRKRKKSIKMHGKRREKRQQQRVARKMFIEVFDTFAHMATLAKSKTNFRSQAKPNTHTNTLTCELHTERMINGAKCTANKSRKQQQSTNK